MVIPPGVASDLAQVGSPGQRTLPVRPRPEPQSHGDSPLLSSHPLQPQPRPAELLWVPVVPERPQIPGRARPWPWPSPLPVFRPSSLPHFRRVCTNVALRPSLPFPVSHGACQTDIIMFVTSNSFFFFNYFLLLFLLCLPQRLTHFSCQLNDCS